MVANNKSDQFHIQNQSSKSHDDPNCKYKAASGDDNDCDDHEDVINNISDNENNNYDDGVERTFRLWLVVPLAIFSFGLGNLPMTVSVMFLDWQEAFQINRAETAAIFSTSVGILFGGAVVCGYATNRFGARTMTIVGSIAAGLGYFLSIFATRKEYLILTSSVMGSFGSCCIQMAAMPALTVIVPGRFQGLVISLSSACAAIMSSLVPLVYKALVQVVSWRYMYTVYASLMIQASVAGMVFTSTIRRPITSYTSEHRKLNGHNTNTVDGNATSTTDKTEFGSSCPELTKSYAKETAILKRSSSGSASLSNGEAEVEVKNRSSTSCPHFLNKLVSKVKASKWNFLFDRLFIAFVAHSGFCLSYILLFPMFFMDFAKTKGFDRSTGILFYTIHYSCSIAGRVLVGLLNTNKRFHSITIYISFSVGCAITFICLIFTKSYVLNLAIVVTFGVGYGACVAMHMKCIADIKTIDSQSYPLALGLCCTLEGIVDFLNPIIIGYTVDKTGTYSVILAVMGCQCLTFSALLWVQFWRSSSRNKKSGREDDNAREKELDTLSS